MNFTRTLIFIFMLVCGLAAKGQDASLADARTVEGFDQSKEVTSFALASDNTRYVGTKQGLIRITPDGVVESVIGGRNVAAIAIDADNNVWAALDPNVIYDPANGTAINLSGEEGLKITCMAFSGTQLWVGTNQGVYVVSVPNQRVLEHHTPANSRLESPVINAIHIEKSKLKWIGTDKGVMRIENDKWKLYEKGHNIKAITENVEGIWIASDDEIWLVDSYNRWAPANLGDGLGTGELRALAADKNGKIFILSEILVQFDPYTDEAVEISYDQDPLMSSGVLMCDLEDNLWVGSLKAGLLTLNVGDLRKMPLTVYAKLDHPACAGGDNGGIEVDVKGGTPPYYFTWEGRDLRGPVHFGLERGTYYLLVTDASGEEEYVELVLEDPPALDASIDIVSEISRAGGADGSIQLLVEGGTPPLAVSWTNGDTSLLLSGLAADSYMATVTDANGCTASAQLALPDGPEVVTAAKKPVDAVDSENIKSLSADALAVGQTLRIEQLSFKADSSTIETYSFKVLDEISKFLKNNPDLVIEIGGHTNGLPDHAYCDRLSTERAKSVADYLYDQGIPETRITYKGYGKRNPVATNATPEGRRKNQRVEIKVLSI